MWIYVQDDLVLAVSRKSMDGNSGWIQIEHPGIDDETLLRNEFDAALYKYEKGEIVPRSEEEIEGDRPEEIVPAEKLSGEDMAEILADHEFRICLMELGIEEVQ